MRSPDQAQLEIQPPFMLVSESMINRVGWMSWLGSGLTPSKSYRLRSINHHNDRAYLPVQNTVPCLLSKGVGLCCQGPLSPYKGSIASAND